MFEFFEVTKKYRNQEALKQLRFAIEPGVTAVVGPNGAGFYEINWKLIEKKGTMMSLANYPTGCCNVY
jgi:ABC-type enterochelin transport system ATPase subunit